MAVAQELVRLYREYYANRLSLADYRYQRGLLLDSLVAADFPADVDPDEDVTISRGDRETVDVAPQPEPAPRKESRGSRWPLIAVVLVALFGGTVYVVTMQLEPPREARPLPVESDAEPAAPRVEPLAAPDTHVAPDVGQPMVEAFLEDDDWSLESLRRFLDAWVSLPAQDRIVAKGAIWFAPLADRLEYEIAEAEEFSATPDSDLQLQQLYATAVGLGLTELAPDSWKPGLAARSVPQPEAAAERQFSQDRVDEVPVVDEAVDLQAQPEQATIDAPAIDVSDPVATDPVATDPVVADTVAEETAARAVPVENDDACRVEQLQTRRRGCFDLLVSGSEGPPMRVVPSGAVANVAVDAPFAISAAEVSRREFVAFCESTGMGCPADPWPGENMPVVNVSRQDAEAYCDWLSAETGYTYRLPTDAEWEYAARAGATTEYPFGDEITAGQARYSSITSYDSPLSRDDRTTQRNEFGLWHVIGNVREWVDSSAAGGEGVTRGGSYADDADGLRLSSRQTLPATDRDAMTGFRVVREL